MRWNFNKVIIPFFGAATPITAITTDQIQKLVIQRKRRVKPKTVWHDITNLRALLNWAIEKNLLAKNPVDGLDTSIIGNTKTKKPPLNLPAVDRAAAAILNPADRAYFDFLRFTGLRKDEANRLRWDDINFDEGYFHCRGTKTDESDAYLPLAPALIESLKKHRDLSTSEFVFPGRSSQTKGKPIYSRRRMFERIQKLTGIKLRPKDMRDIFASTVETDDARVLMALMRHTNLTTTTKYLRAMHERMKDAVSGLGKTRGKTLGESLGESQNSLQGQKSAKNDNFRSSHRAGKPGLRRGNLERKVGGGGQIRTVDAADMSRVL